MTLADLMEEISFLLSLAESTGISIESIEIKDRAGNIIKLE